MKPICQVYAEGRNGHANQQQTPAEEVCSLYEVAKRRHDRDPERKFQIPTLPSMLLYVQRDVLKRASIALANPSIPNQWARSHCSADGRSPPTRAAQRFTLLPMSSCAWATIARSAPRHLTRRASIPASIAGRPDADYEPPNDVRLATWLRFCGQRVGVAG